MILRRLALLVLASLTLSPKANAQPDPRVRSVSYVADQVVPLPVAAGYQLMVSFETGEQIDTIAVGDATGWKVDANKRGDFLFVKMASGAQQTNMTVVTTVRVYQFLLVPVPDNLDSALFAVRFTYPGIARQDAVRDRVRYRFVVSGPAALRPASIVEDGERTILRWPGKIPLPATYRIDDDAGETLANGVIENGAMVIDGIPRTLVFRLGKQVARAIRKPLARDR
jgi:type IV secretion system protein VirB9